MTLSHPLFESIRAVVFDLDGVLYEQETPVPGAAPAVRRVREAGLEVRFLTNTTSRSRTRLVDKLRRMEIRAGAAEIHTPPAAAGRYLRRQGKSALLLVQSEALEEFDGVIREDRHPDAVVVGDLAHEWTFALLNRAFRAVFEHDAELVGLGRTRYWHAGRGLQLDVGPFLAALEYAADAEARVFGKPEPAIFEAVAEDLDLDPGRVAMVGDDVRSDVDAAMKAGMRGVLVRTGKFRPEDLDRGIEPDLTLDSVADLID